MRSFTLVASSNPFIASSNRTILVALCLSLLSIPALVFLFDSESDRSKFDRLQVGMTTAEVRAVTWRTRNRRRFQPGIALKTTTISNDTIAFHNDNMILIIQNDRLIEKIWK